MHDPEFRQLVDVLEGFIERADFTPSELREASVYACINYEMRRTVRRGNDPQLRRAFQALDEFANSRNQG